ncbi:MAG: ABC transporter ATP-binding protein, partial [Saprospiraceae bacterium]|nr:ABC transporter ATP-binding protein [Saprospiraceae bacterium]
MLSINKVSFHYHTKQEVISNADFHIKKGSVLGLLGHNGSGKSTLMRIIARLLLPAKGNITLDGNDYRQLSNQKFYTRMGIMIEEPSFYRHLTVWDNMRIITHYRRLESKVIETGLKSVDMWDKRQIKTKDLSTGMKQRVGIASTMLSDPDIILLDEPTNGLDPDGMIDIRNLILKLKEEGRTLIVSSHLLSEMERICDQVIILRNGQQVFFGDVV